MTRIREIKTTFTAGEVGRDLLGRGDLRAYENGALKLRNVFINPTGGVTRRAGLSYIDTAAGNGKLIAFEFNTEQTYLLVITDEQIDVYADGVLDETIAAPWEAAQISQLAWTQSADTLLFTHPDVPPKKLTRGSGFYVQHGGNANAFIDCEANVNGLTADACFRVGSNGSKTMIVDLYTESTNSVPNVRLDAGSTETSILNLHAQSASAAIYDFSSGEYDAFNAGYPFKNRMRKTSVTDLTTTLQRFDTEFIDTPGTTSIDLSHSVHIVNATGGAITIELPHAGDAVGVEIIVKKADSTGNIVTITEDGGDGPDGNDLQLGGPNDYAVMVSNGAEWFITSSNRLAGNTRYADTSGTYDIDMAVDVYLLSSFGGALTARLPPANAAKAVGRTVTIKKTDSSGNAVTVTEQGGAGPDQSSQSLSAQYRAITVVSNGANWFIVSKYT